MKCPAVRNIIPEYASGDLAPSKAAQVEKHLKECASCTSELSFYRAYLGEASDMSAMPAPDDFTRKLHEKIGIKPLWQRFFSALFLPLKQKLPLEAAGVMALAMIVFFLWRPFEPPALDVVSESGIELSDKTVVQAPAPEEKKSFSQKAPRRAAQETPQKKKLRAAPSSPVIANRESLAPVEKESSDEAAPSEINLAADAVSSAPAPIKEGIVQREVFWISMSKDSLAFQKDESAPAARPESDSMKKSDAQGGTAAGADVSDMRKERAGRQWVVDERIASQVIEAHGMIVSRTRSTGSASYTVEIPFSARDGFIRGIKKLGALSEKDPAEGGESNAFPVRIILIMKR